jgi:hypothetical protein
VIPSTVIGQEHTATDTAPQRLQQLQYGEPPQAQQWSGTYQPVPPQRQHSHPPDRPSQSPLSQQWHSVGSPSSQQSCGSVSSVTGEFTAHLRR